MAMMGSFMSVLVLLVSLGCLPFCMSSPSVSFSLTYLDAQSSRLRSVEADPSDLPEGMPMRDFVAAGRAMHRRIEKHRKMNVKGKLSYKGEAQGDFYLTLPVGSPPQDLVFLVDTGSEPIWSQCSPCLYCNHTTAPRFAFNKSSSYLSAPCNSLLCGQSVGFEAICSDVSTGPSCMFRISYGDNSTSQGPIAIDSFHLGPHFSKPFIFGCAVIDYETVGPIYYSGIMGLSAGPFSFPSQLLGGKTNVPYKFAHCLPDRFTNLNASGVIRFGKYKLAEKLSYTRLAPPYGPLGVRYYFVKLEGITVGESLIKVPKEADYKVISKRGTVFDSGTALTQLVESVYKEFVGEMRKQTAHLPKSAESDQLCYTAALDAVEPPEVPMVTLHFAGKVDLDLGPESILYPAGTEDNSILFCLAFSPTSEDNLNLIGNYQQQNYWVEYNLKTFSLGLAKANCANL